MLLRDFPLTIYKRFKDAFDVLESIRELRAIRARPRQSVLQMPGAQIVALEANGESEMLGGREPAARNVECITCFLLHRLNTVTLVEFAAPIVGKHEIGLRVEQLGKDVALLRWR